MVDEIVNWRNDLTPFKVMLEIFKNPNLVLRNPQSGFTEIQSDPSVFKATVLLAISPKKCDIVFEKLGIWYFFVSYE